MNPDIERVLYDESTLREAVAQVGRRITQDYRDKRPLLVGILKGSVVFMTDLMREIELNCDIDFMVVKSYGNSAVSSGDVRIIKDLDTDIKDRDVIIVEDILDTARTLSKVKQYLLLKKPASVAICTLFDKKDVVKTDNVRADYKCFDVENEFIVGYGLDYAESYRNLRYVGVLKREIYEK